MLNTLIVEDNSVYRSQFGKFLREQWPSIRIDEAWTEDHIFHLIDNNLHDIIFMDIGLPGTNGISLTTKIKSSYPQIPVIIMTGHDEIEYFEAAKEVGADHFFTKDGLDKSKIIEIVNSVIYEKMLWIN
jgi:DNA-binding NarL/FixJ family response regulator